MRGTVVACAVALVLGGCRFTTSPNVEKPAHRAADPLVRIASTGGWIAEYQDPGMENFPAPTRIDVTASAAHTTVTVSWDELPPGLLAVPDNGVTGSWWPRLQVWATDGSGYLEIGTTHTGETWAYTAASSAPATVTAAGNVIRASAPLDIRSLGADRVMLNVFRYVPATPEMLGRPVVSGYWVQALGSGAAMAAR